jgi:pSer/pThr/pTyr-binding forkhead associated (FHA) protein
LDIRNFSGPSLVVRNGKHEGKIFSLLDSDNRWSIGSAGESNLIIDDEGVSSNHAVVQRNNNSWEVTDQMATNVLRVNGTITNKCFLASGDKITLGAIDCEFVLPHGYKVRDNSPASGGKSRFATYFVVALILLIAVAAGVYFGREFV